MIIADIIKNNYFYINKDLIEIKEVAGKLEVIFKCNLKDEVDCVYYWYDHLTRGSKEVQDIETALENKDWALFSLYYLNLKPHNCTLPNTITVFSKETGDIIGDLAMNDKTIQLLSYSEYECG